MFLTLPENYFNSYKSNPMNFDDLKFGISGKFYYSTGKENNLTFYYSNIISIKGINESCACCKMGDTGEEVGGIFISCVFTSLYNASRNGTVVTVTPATFTLFAISLLAW